MRPVALFFVAFASVASCKSHASTSATGSVNPLIAARPYTLVIPAGVDPHAPVPLVIALHGYGGSGAYFAARWGLPDVAEREKFVIAAPDGTRNKEGQTFWNATDACCNFENSKVDDVAYVRAIIDDVATRLTLDKKRVFVIGLSNGGFMAHRLACDLSERIAAVISVAGAGQKDAARCKPTQPVAVMEVHGTDDDVVPASGGAVGGVVAGRSPAQIPSVDETMAAWSDKLGCAKDPERGAAHVDLDGAVPGAETRVDRWHGCRAGLELWTVEGGAHVPEMQPTWPQMAWDFFAAHHKP